MVMVTEEKFTKGQQIEFQGWTTDGIRKKGRKRKAKEGHRHGRGAAGGKGTAEH